MQLSWLPKAALLAGLASAVAADSSNSTSASSSGANCITIRHNFNNTNRIASVAAGNQIFPPPGLDYTAYDWTIDYGMNNIFFGATGGVMIKLNSTKALSGGDMLYPGGRMSTTRQMLYGRFSAKIKCSAVAGVLTTFITMSQVKDEIDWEMIGAQPTQGQSNVFYKGIQEFGKFGGVHTIPQAPQVSPTFSDYHVFTIDWKPDSITWLIDNVVVRTYSINDPLALSSTLEASTPYAGQPWFPNTPSLIQFSVWDGGDSSTSGVSTWAGGPVSASKCGTNFENCAAIYEWVDIQCYDGQGNEVAAWPPNTLPNGKDGTGPAWGSSAINTAVGAPPPSVVQAVSQNKTTASSKSAGAHVSASGLALGLAALLAVFSQAL
ncbi:concanavalin A-like lectin/glucanase domain-containing protein [Polychytrium aggregatum]|uniref:concanavalin A-like lectin/glucanase domain-containing protein n=1 Tax=Polychytrium aggregatum TaxID=110093 RepID=UPI0022FED982|nr:concanavalin A-like lectin/glucanase domain-containing protein [Polychytrium aggregatum]KAI9203712.1 concanavalin A-like lectin/glucanase domain-containing protein [Polychytrium aggregatum]